MPRTKGRASTGEAGSELSMDMDTSRSSIAGSSSPVITREAPSKRKLEDVEDEEYHPSPETDDKERVNEVLKSGKKQKKHRNSTGTVKEEMSDDEDCDIFAPDADPLPQRDTPASKLKRAWGLQRAMIADPLKKEAARVDMVIPSFKPGEYQMIHRLRSRENRTWVEIAKIVNDERVKTGDGLPNVTYNGIYAIFVQGARVGNAIRKSEEKDKEGKEEESEEKKERVWSRQADEVLVRSFKAAREEFWVTVAERFELLTSRKVTPAECAERFEKL